MILEIWNHWKKPTNYINLNKIPKFYLFVFLCFFLVGCLVTTPPTKQVVEVFKKAKKAVLEKNGRAFYELLSFDLQKILWTKFQTVKAGLKKSPKKSSAFLKDHQISPQKFDHWKIEDWMNVILKKGNFQNFQNAKILKLHFQKNFKKASLTYQIPGEKQSQLTLLKEGYSWKIRKWKKSPPPK